MCHLKKGGWYLDKGRGTSKGVRCLEKGNILPIKEVWNIPEKVVWPCAGSCMGRWPGTVSLGRPG